MTKFDADLSAYSDLLSLITGGWIAQAIHVAATLNIADHLAEGPMSADLLAKQVNANERALHRILRALASVGIFEEVIPGVYQSNDKGALLRSSAVPSLRNYAVMTGSEWVWNATGNLLHSATTGRPAFDHLYGAPVFTYAREHSEAQRVLVAGLASRTDVENDCILAAYDFSTARSVADIGGGKGALLIRILQRYPDIRGILMDTPDVIEMAKHHLSQHNLLDRCELVSGDFFEDVPSADVLLLKKVVHDWDDTRAIKILQNVRRSLQAHSRLLLLEAIVPEGNTRSFTKMIDLLMLVLAGGQERTEVEFRDILHRAGLRIEAITPTSTVGIITASAADVNPQGRGIDEKRGQ